MKELELFDRAMNVGYTMLMGVDEQIIPSDSNEIEDMVFIPDPEQTEMELAEDLIDYFESTEEYEKCANIRDVINLNKTLDICLK
jgi:hypothetical protein